MTTKRCPICVPWKPEVMLCWQRIRAKRYRGHAAEIKKVGPLKSGCRTNKHSEIREAAVRSSWLWAVCKTWEPKTTVEKWLPFHLWGETEMTGFISRLCLAFPSLPSAHPAMWARNNCQLPICRALAEHPVRVWVYASTADGFWDPGHSGEVRRIQKKTSRTNKLQCACVVVDCAVIGGECENVRKGKNRGECGRWPAESRQSSWSWNEAESIGNRGTSQLSLSSTDTPHWKTSRPTATA